VSAHGTATISGVVKHRCKASCFVNNSHSEALGNSYAIILLLLHQDVDLAA
jgi:hypothetical protein